MLLRSFRRWLIKTAVSCKHFFPGNATVCVRVNKY
jgi:hypothetical protein